MFSHPQPLFVILHTGVIWPYQLHCWAVAALDAAELGVELATADDLLELATELDATAELAAELEL